ncbi:MAG TPA: SDR family oxidoreductase [Vicinamibacterales bacterium]|nr:SDR family oxidoreductase [Vicinamibacterales bacterium]
MDLAGKVALVTGGKRIGATVAVALAEAGADLALSYHRSKPEAETTAGAVRALGRRAMTCQADLADPDACRRLVAAAARELGRLDVLVNMASIYTRTPFADLTAEDLQRSFDVEVKSAFACAQSAAPLMAAAGGGRIINVSDWLAASDRPRYTGFLAYYVAKKAVIGLTEALALELAPDQILVNAIAPGPILPPPDLDEEETRAVETATPLGRWGGAEEIARTVLALVDSNFITGETFRVDGGRHIR